jgi:SOS-response transcriptional repressor LexA
MTRVYVPTSPATIREKHYKVYDFIVSYKRRHDGNSPTFREIMEGCGISSTSMVVFYLNKLELRRLIRRPEPEIGNWYASKIEVVGGCWMMEEDCG